MLGPLFGYDDDEMDDAFDEGFEEGVDWADEELDALDRQGVTAEELEEWEAEG